MYRFFTVDSMDHVNVVRADSIEEVSRTLPGGRSLAVFGSEEAANQFLQSKWAYEEAMDI